MGNDRGAWDKEHEKTQEVIKGHHRRHKLEDDLCVGLSIMELEWLIRHNGNRLLRGICGGSDSDILPRFPELKQSLAPIMAKQANPAKNA